MQYSPSASTTLSLTLLLLNILSPAQSQHITTASDCLSQRCGAAGLVVSYPFALANRLDCASFSPFFRLRCDEPSSKLLINISTSVNGAVATVEVTRITTDSLIIDVTNLRTGNISCNSTTSGILLPSFPGPFLISDDNSLVSFGCTVAILVTAGVMAPAPAPAPAPSPVSSSSNTNGTDNTTTADHYRFTDEQVSGCAVSCLDEDKNNPEICGNRTCCVSEYPPLHDTPAVRYAFFTVEDQGSLLTNNTTCAVANGNGNVYGTVFHRDYSDFSKESYQIRLKWALPSDQIHSIDALTQSSDYACSPNSHITIVDGVPGYLCNCSQGYIGDGYFNGSGCQDEDECAHANDCVSRSACQNVKGNYTCRCKGRFYVGDGRINGSGCQFSSSIRRTFILVVASASFLLITGGFVCLAIWWKHRTKRKYFLQNGGLQLQTFLGARSGSERTRLFKSEELKAATNNYAEHMKLGMGGFGTVFKGFLDDGTVVAVKKATNMGSKDGADSQQFLNEMDILTRINHRHIVRLLGCCLETQVPLLVYEYVSNGNVAEILAAERGTGVICMSWEQRLKVARQTAEALAYLHAAASPPILHRDVKSANVLLDDNLDVKVADFGLSRLVPDGVEHVSTAVQGTIGYLDPEYFQTLQLTDKSDVYSLGIMLTELITGLKPVDNRNRENCFANLALLFIHQMREGKLDELIDARLTEASSFFTSSTHSSIVAVATLVRQCLALEGSKRPSMSQVADKLRYISQTLQGQANEDGDESTPLLFSGKEEVEHDVELGDTVLKKSPYDSLNSGSIDNMFLTAPR